MQVIQLIRSSAVFLQMQMKSEDYGSAACMTWELAHLLVSVILNYGLQCFEGLWSKIIRSIMGMLRVTIWIVQGTLPCLLSPLTLQVGPSKQAVVPVWQGSVRT